MSKITVKFPNKCVVCGKLIPLGAEAEYKWAPDAKGIRHFECGNVLSSGINPKSVDGPETPKQTEAFPPANPFFKAAKGKTEKLVEKTATDSKGTSVPASYGNPFAEFMTSLTKGQLELLIAAAQKAIQEKK